MDGDALGVVQVKPMTRHEPLQCREGPIEDVLVIDRVELGLFDHVAQVRHLEARDSIILQQNLEPFDEIVDRVDMGGDVVGNHDIGTLTLGGEVARERRTEERLHRRDATLAGAGDRPLGGIDSQDRNASADEVLQQVTVVARDFDHQTPWIKRLLLQDPGDMLTAVLEEGGRKGRVVGIVTAEEHLRRNRLRHLHEGTVVAEGQLQGKARLRLVQLALVQKGVRQRLRPQVEKSCEVRTQARSAAGQSAARAVYCADHGVSRVRRSGQL